MAVFVSFLLLLLCSTHKESDYMNYQFAWAMAILCIPICIYLSKRMGLLFGIFAAYFSTYAMYITMNMHNRYINLLALMNVLSVNAGFAFLICVIFLLGTLHLSYNMRQGFRVGFILYAVCNAIYVIHSAFKGIILMGGNSYAGFLDYGGMNATGMALCCAFVPPEEGATKAERYLRYLALLIIFAGIVLSKTAIPFITLGIVLAVRFVFLRKDLSIVGFWPLLGSFAAGFITVGSKMYHSSERFRAYKIFFSFLKNEKALFFGKGLASLRLFAPQIQTNAHFMVWQEGNGLRGWVWQWLHSDTLQTWWENGLPAFILLILLYFQCLHRSLQKKDYSLLALGCGLGFAGSVNYPCRYAVTAFLVCYFLVGALDRLAPPTEDYPKLKT